MRGYEEGWKEEYTSWWFEFLTERGGKGVSKDTWMMVRTSLTLTLLPATRCSARSVDSADLTRLLACRTIFYRNLDLG